LAEKNTVMNKLITITALFLITTTHSFAQNKIEKFCQVSTHYKGGFTTKRVASISFGEQANLFSFKHSTIVTALQKVNDLTTDTDVLNYMASIGWQFVNIIGVANGWENLYFKKEFDKSELVAQ
jgi:hypothetical protein